MARPTLCTDTSVTLEPIPEIADLHKRLRCSICKSDEMFLDGLPCMLTVLFHISWAAMRGERVNLICAQA